MEEFKELIDSMIKMSEESNAHKGSISYEYRGYKVEVSVTRLKKTKK